MLSKESAGRDRERQAALTLLHLRTRRAVRPLTLVLRKSEGRCERPELIEKPVGEDERTAPVIATQSSGRCVRCHTYSIGTEFCVAGYCSDVFVLYLRQPLLHTAAPRIRRGETPAPAQARLLRHDLSVRASAARSSLCRHPGVHGSVLQ